MTALLAEAPGVETADRSIFAPPWAGLDDESLLAHFRSPRPVRIDLVVDTQECTPQRLDAILDGGFEFNGETHHLPDPIDWLHNPSADIEWHILLHKCYYAAGLGQRFLESGDSRFATRWQSLLDSWIRQVPAGFIAADVTGRRVQNWIYSTRAFVNHGVPHQARIDAAFFRRLLVSLHEQVEFLCANLTPKRNHRTLELYAIFLAGVAFPEMERSAHWRTFALEQTLANLQADLLPDGVHCELSTDYHHLAVRNWLHVRTLASRHGVPVPAEMDTLLERALHFSLHVHKPDGVVPSLSDGDPRSFLPLLAAGAELYRREDMRWVATRGVQGTPPRTTLACFAHSGYTVLRSGWGDAVESFGDAQYIVFDHGPVGEGNHGHFDALSFELAANGRSLVVDPGRYTYSEAGPVNWRVHFRGTPAHNTVCVDGRQQTRYEAKPVKGVSRHTTGSVRHRIAGPAPETRLHVCAQTAGLSLLQASTRSHEYDTKHLRTIVHIDGRWWLVSDTLLAPTIHDYTLNFQLHPTAQGTSNLSEQGPAWHLHSPGLDAWTLRGPAQSATLAGGWVSPSYGRKLAAPALRCHERAADARFDTLLMPWRDEAPAGVRFTAEATQAEPGLAGSVLRVDSGSKAVHRWFHSHADAPASCSVAGLSFHGHWLYLRHAADGQLLRAISHPGARLARDGTDIALVHAQERAAS